MEWIELFDHYGIKKVTKTDKSKSAYVPNNAQKMAINAADIQPKHGNSFNVTILGDAARKIEASYYHAERSDTADRPPEPRMGREFISHWLEIGDEILIGNIGKQLFAIKLTSSTDKDVLVENMACTNPTAIFEKANRAKGKPKTIETVRTDFVRDPFVVRAALLRSGGKCEMPDCKTVLFLKEDGIPYLEVHHITPLSEGGEDTLVNAAALCPNCHREQHHGKEKMTRRKLLLLAITRL
ncbi:MAG: HNH endonuclease [Formivibrio sp.]|nr:HNH endonuclease [Formivibrio sp.]